MAQQALDINEQTADAPQEIVKGAGDSAITSFEELENLEVADDRSEQIKQAVKNKTAEKISKEKDEDEELDEEEEEQVAESEEKLEKVSDKKDSKDEVEKAAEQHVKLLKAKVDGKELELRADTEFTVNVRGEPVKVTARDLLDNFSGKTDWSKKYSDLNTEKQKFESEKRHLQGYVNDLHSSLMVKKDAVGALSLLAQAMGGDPVTVVKEFQKQIREQAEKWVDLTPEQRKEQELQDEIALYRRKEESDKQAATTQADNEEINQRTESVMQEHGLTTEKFTELYHQIKDKVDPGDLTPELIGEYYKAISTREAIGGLLKDVGGDINNFEGAVDKLYDVMKANPSLTIEDIRDIAVQAYGDKRAKILSKKLRKSRPIQTADVSPDRRRSPLTFDDLDE